MLFSLSQLHLQTDPLDVLFACASCQIIRSEALPLTIPPKRTPTRSPPLKIYRFASMSDHY